jgi:ribosomal protein S11
MKLSRAASIALVLALVASPAFADVTLKITMSITGGPAAMDMPMVSYVKGTKMRSDTKAMGQDMSIIMDVVTKEQLMIDHVNKQVSTLDLQAVMAALPVNFGEVTASITPNGQTREVLGRTCSGFDVTITIPMSAGGEAVTMTMSGAAWLAKDGAGVAEYQAFQKAASAAGMLASPLGQGPQAKGMLQMQKALSEAGVPMLQELQMRVDGSGEMAQAMSQMAMTMTMTVTEISTTPIPDDTFAVPAGYTKK